MEEKQEIFEIAVDSSGFYTTEHTENIVEVNEIPCVEDVRYLKAYHYDENSKELILDSSMLEKIRQEIELEDKIPKLLERVNDLENVVVELTNMVLGGE
jgi:hypothetical protein